VVALTVRTGISARHCTSVNVGRSLEYARTVLDRLGEFERLNDEVEFYAAANERHGINGPLKVRKRIEALFTQVQDDYPTIFKESEVVDLKAGVLAYPVTQLQMYSLLESDIDVKGRAYEEIVGSNLRGDRGEFFTPRT
jgi:type I restriction enzyme M protein